MALAGVKILEFAGLAPVPYAGLILADFGADVICVDRPTKASGPGRDPLRRGKRSIVCNLKNPTCVATIKQLVRKVDVVIEPFRPGVMERLGLGPDVLCEINPRLIYARLTGFGQTGPYANMAGHDINYIAASGVLSMIKREGERPLPPLNLLGDFAAGGMMCAMGIMLAVIERGKSGRGQIVDSAMTDGTTYLASMVYDMHQAGAWNRPTGTNLLDSGSHFYNVYTTKDGKYMSVGAIEPQFYAELLKGLGIDAKTLPPQMDMRKWPQMKERFASVFATKTRDQWQQIFDGTDACCVPVINIDEVGDSRHHAAQRGLLVAAPKNAKRKFEPAPAPRLSRTPGNGGSSQAPPVPLIGEDTQQVLSEFGLSAAESRAYIEACSAQPSRL